MASYLRFILASLLLWFGTSESLAQFGIRGQAVNATIPFSADSPDQESAGAFAYWGFDLGVNYWFRLQNHRLEFYPEVSYGQFNTEGTTRDNQVPLKLDRIGISVPMSVYLLDFNSDCECPTFSKQNDLIKKGFFIQVVPAFYQVRSAFVDPGNTTYHWTSQPSIGFGAGLDIGISDLITVSPMAHYFLAEESSDDLAPHSTREWRLGMRVSFRPDY